MQYPPIIAVYVFLFAVSDQSERDQNEKGHRAVAASSRILSRANKVSVILLIDSLCESYIIVIVR